MQIYFLEEKVLDIENVFSCFEELCNFLDAVDSMFSHIRDIEAEIVEEMASYSEGVVLRHHQQDLYVEEDLTEKEYQIYIWQIILLHALQKFIFK